MKEKSKTLVAKSASRWRQLRCALLRLRRFLAYDLWQMSGEDSLSPFLRLLVQTLRVVYETTRSFINDHLVDKAASLTYSTVLSIVPMLAVIVGIAKGFGLQVIVRSSLMEALPGHHEQIEQIFVYVENYLNQVQGGLFIGLGMAILLYTVLMLTISVEDTFNDIWQAPRARPWSRRIFNYLGFFFLLPLVMTASALVTLVVTTIRTTYLADTELLRGFFDEALMLTPLIVSTLIFTLLFVFLPNVRVYFLPALISGLLSAVAFQIFQTLYINGVIWISRYNAIYGSFAAFPLLLLWMQLSWSITLYGAQLSYVIQNIHSFAYGQASLRVSRRYLDFVAILMLSRMVQRFSEVGKEPYRAGTLSDECHIPLRMAVSVLSRLDEVGLITAVHFGDEDESYYQPAVDPSLLTVGYVVAKLDRFGTEDFRIDRFHRYSGQWQAMLTTRGERTESYSPDTLLSQLL